MLAALYSTKKELKTQIGQSLVYEETSIFGDDFKRDGRFCVVGPSPTNRKWFAEVTMKDGKILKVS